MPALRGRLLPLAPSPTASVVVTGWKAIASQPSRCSAAEEAPVGRYVPCPWAEPAPLPTTMEEIHRQALERVRWRIPRRRVVIGPDGWETTRG